MDGGLCRNKCEKLVDIVSTLNNSSIVEQLPSIHVLNEMLSCFLFIALDQVFIVEEMLGMLDHLLFLAEF
jgi:hypothetical protein